MIATEEGLTFAKDGTAWRCLQVPGLWMLAGGGYAIRGATGEFYIPGAMESHRVAERDLHCLAFGQYVGGPIDRHPLPGG